MILPPIIIVMLVANVCRAPPTKKMHDPYSMVLRRPMMSPTRPTVNDETNAPISNIATMVPTVAFEGSLKYSLK
jgi:hypothetical protein